MVASLLIYLRTMLASCLSRVIYDKCTKHARGLRLPSRFLWPRVLEGLLWMRLSIMGIANLLCTIALTLLLKIH
jgi:hypothetical protein